MAQSYNVAVIGAGTAGLMTARELQRQRHRVTVFEKSNNVGGTWLYNPRVETDPFGIDPTREVVHTSLYRSLRVNLPRHIMGFLDYPFVKKEGGDPRSFPGHEEVLRFLEDFARDFGLVKSIRFGHEVLRVERVDEASHECLLSLGLEGRSRDGSQERRCLRLWLFAMVNTRSHKLQNFQVLELMLQSQLSIAIAAWKFPNPLVFFPKVAALLFIYDSILPDLYISLLVQFSLFCHVLGRDAWPGLQMHSHNYRTPEQFENKIVVVIGNGSSASDILKEVSPLAKQVHQAVRGPGFQLKKLENHKNTWQHSMIECARKDGKVVFQDGSIVDADVIIHCTAYKYHFPFLRSNGIITVENNHVGPLYKHVFPPSLAPWLSFVGLPNRAVPTLVIELQAKWVAKVLSGKVELPTQKEMAISVQELYRQMEKTGWPAHQTHNLQQDKFDYDNWLVAQLGSRPLEKWREVMFFCMKEIKSYYGDNYRDTWDVDKWIQEIDSSN